MKNKKEKILHLIDRAKFEMEQHKKFHRFVNLSQACEKTWVAFVLALEYASGREIRNGIERKNVAYSLGLGELYQKVRNLHVLHYEGSPAAYDEETYQDIVSARGQILGLIDKERTRRIVHVRGYQRR